VETNTTVEVEANIQLETTKTHEMVEVKETSDVGATREFEKRISGKINTCKFES
jgi:hypothetical protein